MTIATDDVDLERDRRLVRQCQDGQAEAFAELFAIYHHRLVRHCAQRLGSTADAEDVAQEAFIRAWRAIGRFDGRRFYPWLHVIASNACTDALRRTRPTATLSELAGSAELDDAQGVEDQFASSIDASMAGKAMQLLNERHRRVLYFREELEWSVQDIAAQEGLEANAIDSLLWRARAALRLQFHRLSKGAAALIASGTTGFMSVRNRLIRVAHILHGPGGVPLPARAAVAAAIVIGAAVSSAPLLSSPSTHQHPAVGGRISSTVPEGTGSASVTPGRTGSTVAPSDHESPQRGPVVTGPGTAAAPGVPGQGLSSVVPASGGSQAAPAIASAATGTLGTVTPPVTLASSTIVSTVGGTTKTAVGVVTGIAGSVVSAAGGTVQTVVGSPVVAPVVQPVHGSGSGRGAVLGITLP